MEQVNQRDLQCEQCTVHWVYRVWDVQFLKFFLLQNIGANIGLFTLFVAALWKYKDKNKAECLPLLP